MHTLRQELEYLSLHWIAHGLPSREQVLAAARALIRLKRENRGQDLWPTPPKIITATLDDAVGQGIDVINLFAQAMGIDVTSLGLLQRPETIVSACRAVRPEYLGLTVLQPDSEDALAFVGRHLPPGTLLLAGGPAFKYDPDLALRCGVHATPANVAYFIDFILHGDTAPNRGNRNV